MAKGELGVSDMAQLWGCHRTTAYRRMRALERRYGTRVVGRKGESGEMYTTFRAIREVAPEVQQEKDFILDRLDELEIRVASLERASIRVA